MPVYTGIVKRIGVGTWQNGYNKLSVLEIGEHSIRDVSVNDYLKNYLEDGLRQEITIMTNKAPLIGEIVVAIKIDGVEYTAQPASATTRKVARAAGNIYIVIQVGVLLLAALWCVATGSTYSAIIPIAMAGFVLFWRFKSKRQREQFEKTP